MVLVYVGLITSFVCVRACARVRVWPPAHATAVHLQRYTRTHAHARTRTHAHTHTHTGKGPINYGGSPACARVRVRARAHKAPRGTGAGDGGAGQDEALGPRVIRARAHTHTHAHTLASLPSAIKPNRQIFCAGDRLKMVKRKARAAAIVLPRPYRQGQ